MLSRNFLATCLGVISVGSVAAADWPQFRGPNGTAVALNSKPLVEWTKTEGIVWKTELPGPGSSSPIIVGDRVFVTCYSGYGTKLGGGGDVSNLKRQLVCLDRKSGKISWKSEVNGVAGEDNYRGFLTEHGYASHTPACDGTAVYVFFGKAGVAAFDLEGKKLWRTSVGTGSDERGWGSSASPVLTDKHVIVNASSEQRAIVALDKKTGAVAWKADGKKLSLSFGTPALVKVDNSRTDLVVAMPGEVWGLNPENGKLAWYAAIKPSGNISPSVIPGDGVVYITGGFQTRGSAAVKVGGKGEINTIWSAKSSSYVPTPLLEGGKLYVVTDDGNAVCQNANDGAVVSDERLSVKGTGGKGSRPFYASPVYANGHVYAVSRKAGVFVLKTGEKFEQVAQNPALDDSDFNATPAISGDHIFLRSNQAIYCIGKK